MNIREAKAIIAKAENEYQKKLANEVHLKMADLGAPAKTLLGAGIGAGLGAGASFLGSEFVGMPKEDDPDLAALKLKRRRLGALLAGAGMGSLGGAVVGNVGVLDNMLTPTDPNAPNNNGPSAMEKWKGDLGKWWKEPWNTEGILEGAGAVGATTYGLMSDSAARAGTALRNALGINNFSLMRTKTPAMGSPAYNKLIEWETHNIRNANKGMDHYTAQQEAIKRHADVAHKPATNDVVKIKRDANGNEIGKITRKGTPEIKAEDRSLNRFHGERTRKNQFKRRIAGRTGAALTLAGLLAAAYDTFH
jgi:hypothetical protein